MLWRPYATGLATFSLRTSIGKALIGCTSNNSNNYVPYSKRVEPWCLLKMDSSMVTLSATPYEKGDYDNNANEKVEKVGSGGGGRSLHAMGIKKGSRRQLRLGRLFAKELGDIIRYDKSLGRRRPRISSDIRAKVSIVEVEVSPDFRNANVWFSCYGDRLEKRQAARWCYLAIDQIRHSLSKRLRHMKSIPQLVFTETDIGRAVDLMNLIEKNSVNDVSLVNDMVDGATSVHTKLD